MRRIVRSVAAGFVVVLGLALVSAAALGDNSTSPLGRPSAPRDDIVKSVAPFVPTKVDKAAVSRSELPNPFESEFGKRGKHAVVVVVTGSVQYAITWRGQPEAEWGAGNVERSRTIKGGFPVAQVAINGGSRAATCRIIVDGIEKDQQSTSSEVPVVFCGA